MKHRSSTLKRISAALLIAALLPALSGCGAHMYANYRDLGMLQPIQTVGIDGKGGMFTITVSSGENSTGNKPVIISRSGESIVSAKEAVQNYSSSESLYFAHTEFVVFGEEAAKNSIEEYLDYTARGADIRMDASLFVVKDETAEDLIIESGEMDIDVTQNFDAIKRDVRRQGTAFVFSGHEIASRNAEFGSALICAINPPQSDGEPSVDESKMALSPAGYGIIRQGKLCGFLDEELRWAANVLLGKSGFASLDLRIDDDLEVSLFSVTSNSDYSAQWNEDGSLDRILVDVEVKGYLIEMSASPTAAQEDEFLNALTDALESKTESRCLEVLKRSQKLEADFLGLLGVLQKKYPSKVYALDSSFIEALTGADIEVSVKGTVYRSFDLEGVPQILDGGVSQ